MSSPHRPVRRAFLEAVDRAVLARLLREHAEPLRARGFDIDRFAASAPTERAEVHALFDALAKPDEGLRALHEALRRIDDATGTTTHEALLARDAAKVLDPELGVETLLTIVYLDYRELFDCIRPLAPSAARRPFAHLTPKSNRPLVPEKSLVAKMNATMSALLGARGRSSYFRSYWTRLAQELHLDVVYCKLASTRDIVAKTGDGETYDLVAQVTDRSTERAEAIVNVETGILSLAGYDWMKELLRRTIGEVFFDDPDHYLGDESLTLDPLVEDLEGTLKADGVPGLKRVELVSATVEWPDRSWLAFGAKGDVRATKAGAFGLRALRDGAKVVEAEILVHVDESVRKKPVSVKIVAPKRMAFDRSDPRVVRIVRDWMVARGVMKMPEGVEKVGEGGE